MSRHHQSSLMTAVKYASAGISETFRNERNFRIELLCALFALVVSFLLRLQPAEWAIIVVLIILVLSLELANSALENLVDLASPEYHPLARKAKDAMAGAVLVAALGSALCGLIIFVAAALRVWGS